MSTEMGQIEGRKEKPDHIKRRSDYQLQEISVTRFSGGKNGVMAQVTVGGYFGDHIQLDQRGIDELIEALKECREEKEDKEDKDENSMKCEYIMEWWRSLTPERRGMYAERFFSRPPHELSFQEIEEIYDAP